MLHIESLKKSNSEMNSALNAIIDGNKEKLKSMLSSKIEPWIKSLKIPDEHQTAFMQGIEVACHEGQYKGMTDFEKNPAFTVACAAAAAHGEATQAAEQTRIQLQVYMQEADARTAQQVKIEKDLRADEHRVLFSATAPSSYGHPSSSTGSVLGKRPAATVYEAPDEDMTTSKCWSTVFSSLSA